MVPRRRPARRLLIFASGFLVLGVAACSAESPGQQAVNQLKEVQDPAAGLEFTGESVCVGR